MTRLIDADALSEKLCETTIFIKDGEVFQHMINDAPTIDAVEVVRCMNCIYGEERIENYICGKLDEDWEIRFSPTHFCSYGKRREDGEA